MQWVLPLFGPHTDNPALLMPAPHVHRPSSQEAPFMSFFGSFLIRFELPFFLMPLLDFKKIIFLEIWTFLHVDIRNISEKKFFLLLIFFPATDFYFRSLIFFSDHSFFIFWCNDLQKLSQLCRLNNFQITGFKGFLLAGTLLQMLTGGIFVLDPSNALF